ncbi:MAG: glycine cleavage system regulatory protein [Moritella sp.]|jgi:glycine cleavage system regulatory protein
MLKQLIVTLIGDDKSGLIKNLSSVVTEHKGNWLASNMSELAGQFAGILQISVTDEHYRDLCEALSLIPGLTINFAEGKNHTIWQKSPCLIIQDKDRPGIISEVSQVLTAHNIELKAITTHCKDLWQSNDNQFYAKLKLVLPTDLDNERFNAELSLISPTLIADIVEM